MKCCVHTTNQYCKVSIKQENYWKPRGRYTKTPRGWQKGDKLCDKNIKVKQVFGASPSGSNKSSLLRDTDGECVGFQPQRVVLTMGFTSEFEMDQDDSSHSDFSRIDHYITS